MARMAKTISKNHTRRREAPMVRKGPWTPEEDIVLLDHVKKHGLGRWNDIPRDSELLRSGKSCRLRWFNHLRPDLKKGVFEAYEKRIIVELHAMLGNKWSKIAARLPGRTDNEIKNYWNTRIKHRKKSRQPLYPPEVVARAEAFRHQLQQQNPPQNLYDLAHYNTDLPPPPELEYSDPNSGSGGDLALPPSPVSTAFGSSPSTLFNEDFVIDYHGGNDFMVASPKPPVTGSAAEISASQIEPPGSATPVSYNGATSSIASEYQEVATPVSRGIAAEEVEGSDVKKNNATMSPGKKLHGDSGEEMKYSLDDDLFDLLNSFVLEVPVQDWYPSGSRGESVASLGFDAEPFAPSAGLIDGQELEWSLGDCWNNMPDSK